MPSAFGYILGSGYGNVPNELVHRAGPSFLDNHYCGYQLFIVQTYRIAGNFRGVQIFAFSEDAHLFVKLEYRPPVPQRPPHGN